MKTRTIGATEFKAHCLALLNEVEETGQSITITKRGRAVAILHPPERQPWKTTRDGLAGKVKIIGDIDNFDMADLWNVVREVEEAKKQNH